MTVHWLVIVMDKGQSVNIVKSLVDSAHVNRTLLDASVRNVKSVTMDSPTANVCFVSYAFYFIISFIVCFFGFTKKFYNNNEILRFNILICKIIFQYHHSSSLTSLDLQIVYAIFFEAKNIAYK